MPPQAEVRASIDEDTRRVVRRRAVVIQARTVAEPGAGRGGGEAEYGSTADAGQRTLPHEPEEDMKEDGTRDDAKRIRLGARCSSPRLDLVSSHLAPLMRAPGTGSRRIFRGADVFSTPRR